jgi:hypothetical protein
MFLGNVADIITQEAMRTQCLAHVRGHTPLHECRDGNAERCLLCTSSSRVIAAICWNILAIKLYPFVGPPLWSSGQSSWLQIQIF